MMRYFSICIGLIFSITGFGQILASYDIPIFDNGQRVLNPFVGGLKAGQFSNIDLDEDGVKDLLVFDRNSSVISTFLQKGARGESRLVYAPEYVDNFPAAEGFMLLYDFNGDGIEDIFKDAGEVGVFGIQVWRGKRDANGLYFEQMVFEIGDTKSTLNYPNGSFYPNIYCSIIDVPGIHDVDGDGDTDILSFDVDGSYLNYYRNFAVERGLGIDTFVMEFEELCFGGFAESGTSSDVKLNPIDVGCAPGILPNPNSGGGPRHSGSTTLAFDGDCDGDTDLILGDFLSNTIVYLENGGNAINPFITKIDHDYPSVAEKVHLPIFLGAYLADVNNDDLKDLIITPNQKDAGLNIDHVWLYINEGTACNPVFRLEEKDFLIKDMLHFYKSSHPQFCDYDGDGLLDILVGTGGILGNNAKVEKRIILLENIGTKTSPAYNIVDKDYLKLSEASEDLLRISLDIVDIDGDGDDDLFTGSSDGTLYFWENLAGPEKKYNFTSPITDYANIYAGSSTSPDFYDFDGDGDYDLALGKFNNQFLYFENRGTPQNPVFSEQQDLTQFGNIFRFNDINTKSGSPVFFESAGELQAILGVSNGDLIRYKDISTNELDTFTLINQDITPLYVGQFATADLADINDDKRYEIIVGNERGGLHLFTSDIKVESALSTTEPIENTINIYPNPVRNQMVVSSDIDQAIIYSINGNKVLDLGSMNAQDVVDLSHIPKGMYILKGFVGGKYLIGKFTKG